ncbi:Cytochrome b559 subunit alpha [Platanthera zijinensis]|uniref:Cytochrome b559 subunit alpha n=1 Tax=Platanthera zijinensis TaxID=2320716 RepID=A0AAP0BUR4_9ASPA
MGLSGGPRARGLEYRIKVVGLRFLIVVHTDIGAYGRARPGSVDTRLGVGARPTVSVCHYGGAPDERQGPAPAEYGAYGGWLFVSTGLAYNVFGSPRPNEDLTEIYSGKEERQGKVGPPGVGNCSTSFALNAVLKACDAFYNLACKSLNI